MDVTFVDLGADACWPLAVFATSRGRGTSGALVPEATVCEAAAYVSQQFRASRFGCTTFIAIAFGCWGWIGLGKEIFRDGNCLERGRFFDRIGTGMMLDL